MTRAAVAPVVMLAACVTNAPALVSVDVVQTCDTAGEDSCADWTPPEVPSSVPVDTSCGPTLLGTLDPAVEWAWDGNGQPFDQVMTTPVVAPLVDTDGDGLVTGADVPRVAFLAFRQNLWSAAGGALVILDGATGAQELLLTEIVDVDGNVVGEPASVGGVAIGDLQGDGAPEICFVGRTAHVICATTDGTALWWDDTSPTTVRAEAYPSIADLDGDGLAEVIVGRRIYSAEGLLLGQGTAGAGGYGAASSFVAVADFLPSTPGQEIAAGNAIYDVEGATLWASGESDAATAAGDLDGDGVPEIVRSVGSVGVVAHNLVTGMTWTWQDPTPVTSVTGPAVIVDVEGDGSPEVGVSRGDRFVLLDAAGTLRWEAPVTDLSPTGASAVDLDGDGVVELLYADHERVHAFDGVTGVDRFDAVFGAFAASDHASGTLSEYPVPVDVDRDGSVEIVLASNNYARPGWKGVRAVGSATSSWAAVRSVWNQHGYVSGGVDDDGGVPIAPGTPTAFRAASPVSGGPLANLVVGAPAWCPDVCSGDTASFWVPVSNAGGATAEGGEVRLYDDLAVVATMALPPLAPGASTLVGPLDVPLTSWNGVLRAVVVASDTPQCSLDDDEAVVGERPCP